MARPSHGRKRVDRDVLRHGGSQLSATSLRSCSYACGNYIDIKSTGEKEKAFSVRGILDKNGGV